MKIISGKWGGQSIPGKSSPKMRPTSDKIREAVFDQLEARFITSWENLSVLDLFAGTGSYGLEALSRGAKSCVFVDHHLAAVRNLKEVCQHFGVGVQVDVLCKGALEAVRWLHKNEASFDLIFLDPPYREDWVLATLNTLQLHPLLKKNGLVIAEHDKREPISPIEGVWKVETSRRYGDSMISLLRPKEQ